MILASKTTIKRFLARVKAASLTEFGIVVGLIAVLSIQAVFFLGDRVETVFCKVTKTVESSVFGDDSRVCLEFPGGGGDGEGEEPLVADARYPNSVTVDGVNYVWHVNADHPIATMPLDTNEPATIVFSEPLPLAQIDLNVNNTSPQPGTLYLEYQNGANWTAVVSQPIAGSTLFDQTLPFTATEAATWRLRVEGDAVLNVRLARLGTASEIPPLLPAITLDSPYIFTLNIDADVDFATTTTNTADTPVYQFSMETWNGVTFNANGSITGIPDTVVPSPGLDMQVRVRDGRNIWSDWFDFSAEIASDLTADLQYPTTGDQWISFYDASNANAFSMAPTEFSTFSYAQPVSTNTWSITSRNFSSTTTTIELEYQDSLGQWLPVERASVSNLSGTNFVTQTVTFDTVTAQNFRVINDSFTGRSVQVTETRLGFNETFPAFLPHLTAGNTIDIPVTGPSTLDFTTLVANAVGTLEFEFNPTTRNGLTYNADGTVTGTPTATVGEPGNPTTIRFRDSRGIWSNTYTVNITSLGDLVASAIYPISGSHIEDGYSDARKGNEMLPNAYHLITFDSPVKVSNWNIGLTSAFNQGVTLQYKNGLGNWVSLETVRDTDINSTVQLYDISFDEVTAQEFRLENTSSNASTIYTNRLGHDNTYPAFLPHIVADTTVIGNINQNLSDDFSEGLRNTQGTVEFEFTPATWNTLTFGSDGTVTGTPTQARSGPGEDISVRIRDARNIWSTPTNVKVIVNSDIVASTTYPQMSSEAQDYYTGTSNVVLGTNGIHLITFDQPTTVSSWSATINPQTSLAMGIELQYKNSSDQWVRLAREVTNSSGARAYNVNFLPVIAQEFRIQGNATGTYQLLGSRLGHEAVFPAFLPGFSAQTYVIEQGEPFSVDLAPLVTNVNGTPEFEFSANSWNGLTLSSTGTITGTPTAVVAAPGQTFTARVRDSRGIWSKPVSIRITVNGIATADLVYPTTGTHVQDYYTNDGTAVTLSGSNIHTLTFAEPTTVSSWRFRSSHTGGTSAHIQLEYLDTQNNWVRIGLYGLGPQAAQDYSFNFTPVTATQFRISDPFANRVFSILHSRLGHNDTYPAFLPHVNTFALTTTQGVAANENITAQAQNTVGTPVFEFTPSTLNGLTFNSNGTITGTPTTTTITPGTSVSVRVRDDRNQLSKAYTMNIQTHSSTLASNTYPASGTALVSNYTDDGTNVTIVASDNQLLTFTNPVYAERWNVRFASFSTSNTRLTLQYRNASGTWISLVSTSSNSTTMRTNNLSFTGVTASEFRILNDSGIGARVEHSRLGAGSQFPDFYPHLTNNQTFTFTQGQAANTSLSSTTFNSSGSVTYEFTPTSLNGLSLNADGTITGTPTASIGQPGQSITVRLRDARNVQSAAYTARIVINSNVLASTTTPTSGSQYLAYYRDTDGLVALNGSASDTFTFAQPVLVDSWNIAYSSSNTSNTSVSLQYLNQIGTWTTLATVVTNQTTQQNSTQTFAPVTATQFRLLNSSGVRANIFHSRVGTGSTFPAFLP